jgi:hypothetical protein
MRIVLAAAVTVLIAGIAVNGKAQTVLQPPVDFLYGYQICTGQYALCAASTCTPNSQMITVNVAGGGTAQFPEAACTCPVYNGSAIADVNGGNMHGSCAVPAPGQVWSLFWPMSHIPQAINDWKKTPAATAVEMQLCSASENVGATFANCFSFACTLDKKPTNGVKTATCLCPLGEGLDGSPVAADSPVFTPAGQCNSQICSQSPVGAPFAAAGDAADECLGPL